MLESPDKHCKKRTDKELWARRKGYESFGKYQKELAKREGFESYSQYQRYAALKKSLKGYPIVENLGEDISNATLNECKAFIAGGKRLPTNKRAILSAMTYKVLREKGEAIILDEIAGLFNVDRWELAKCFRIFYGMEKIPQPDVKSLVEKYARNLHLPEEVEESAMQIYKENEDILRKFRPTSSAAVCLYLVGGKYEVAEEEVAREAKRTPATMRNIMRILRESKRTA